MTRNLDLLAGLALMALSALLVVWSLGIEQGPDANAVGPGVVPLICSFGLLLCGLILTVQSWRRPNPATGPLMDRRQWMVAGLSLGYLAAYSAVDFRLGTLVYVAACMALLGCRNWRALVLTPLATMAFLWLVFQNLFKAALPTWI